jgi:hypothetical protein
VEIYTIAYDDHYIVYRPLLRLAFAANAALVNRIAAMDDAASTSFNDHESECYQFLERVGFFRPDPAPPEPDASTKPWRPTCAVLCLWKDIMIEMDTFKVILLGVAPNSDRATVCDNLAKAFRTTPERIEHLISTSPVTIKTNIDHQTALGYMEIIQTAGGQCKIADEHPGDPAEENQQGASAALKTCGNCGYAATTPDDPLFTAYDGKGECPACGTIAAKLAESQESVPEPDPVNANPEDDDDTPSPLMRTIGSVLSRPWTALFLVLAAVGIVYGFLQDSAPDKKQEKVALTEKTAPATTPSPEPAAQQPDIYTGETREVMVTLYLPYLHRDAYSSMRIKPKT